MSSSNIPQKTQNALWAKAAGRCEFRGCNKELIGDLVAGREDGNFGFIAHIVADSPKGPRGDVVKSPELKQDLSNLMLLCPIHHKGVDTDWLNDHPVELLLEMKAEHEERIKIVTDMDKERAAHVLRFAADIGKQDALFTAKAIFSAMPPERHPADGKTIDIELVGSAIADHEPEYWAFQKENLKRQFTHKIKQRIEQREIKQLSVFALAPQPLLIELGRLLGSIVPTVLHQKRREPDTWRWLTNERSIEFEIQDYAGAPARDKKIALKLALSATIADDRITAVLGSDVALWSITAKNPNLDIMKSPEDLSEFRSLVQTMFNRIKAVHGEDSVINIFPALPASAAITVGKAWMPKADLPLKIWDQNRIVGGFIPALDISS